MPFPVIPYADWTKMGQFLPLVDGRVFYVHKGKGFPVIMVHFFGGNSWWYSRVIDSFAERYSVYALDLPGCGQSETPDVPPYEISEMADALKEFADKLGLERMHLLGIGGGSQTLVHFASTWPARVAKLVLTVLPHWTRAEGKRLWREQLRRNLDENELPKPFSQWGARPDAFQALDEGTRKMALQRLGQDFTEHGRWWVGIMRGQTKYDTNTRFHLIQAPTLVVHGEKIPSYYREGEKGVVEAIKGARLEIVPGAGIWSPFEQPEVYSRVILDFLGTPQ